MIFSCHLLLNCLCGEAGQGREENTLDILSLPLSQTAETDPRLLTSLPEEVEVEVSISGKKSVVASPFSIYIMNINKEEQFLYSSLPFIIGHYVPHSWLVKHQYSISPVLWAPFYLNISSYLLLNNSLSLTEVCPAKEPDSQSGDINHLSSSPGRHKIKRSAGCSHCTVCPQ